MTEDQSESLLEAAKQLLVQSWNTLPSLKDARTPGGTLPDSIVSSIERSVNSKIKTYRYVLPTQLVAKVVNPALDCRSVQATSGLTIAFDARSLCDHVIVPFDRENHAVLGGSTEPYVNKPLRIPSLTAQYRKQQKDKQAYDDLTSVLEYVQKHPEQALEALLWTLHFVSKRLEHARVIYPVPNRISLAQTETLVERFLRARSGGLRLQAVGVALFRIIGKRFSLYHDVRSRNINAADASTGGMADLECVNAEGSIVLAVEIKDRKLTLKHTQDKLPSARQEGIREVLFLVQGGVDAGDESALTELLSREFAQGQNLYMTEFNSLLRNALILFAEEGRREFLLEVGRELDARGIDLVHRQDWANLLEK